MKYLLFITLLLTLINCSKKPDTPECKALETIYTAYNNYYTCYDEVRSLHNKYVRKAKEMEAEGKTEEDFNKFMQSEAERMKSQGENPEREFSECFTTLKGSFESVPTEILKKMTYFHHFYSLFDPANNRVTIDLPEPYTFDGMQLITIDEQGVRKEVEASEASKVLKAHPLPVCTNKKIEESGIMKTGPSLFGGENKSGNLLEEKINKIILLSLECIKELGDKGYKESKKKLKCD